MKKSLEKVWIERIFCSTFATANEKNEGGDDKGHGFVLSSWLKGTTEVIEMIAIDKETVRDKERK